MKKPQVVDPKNRVLVSAFEENLGRLALVSKDNRINVYDTAAGTVRVQCYAAAAKQVNNQYTSITWGKSGVKIGKGERGGVNDVAVGTHSGAIYIWDLLTAQIVLALGEKGEGHVGSVNDLVFHHQGGAAGYTLYSCGADGYIIQWDLRNNKPALKWQCNTAGGVSRIATHSGNGHSLIATADTSIKVWDLSSQKTLIKFTAEKITNLQFTPGGDYLLATGSDRVINMWSCKQQDISANKKNVFKAFSCDSIPITLRINKKKSKNSYQFLALSEGGLINIFDTNTQSKGIAPASSVVKLEEIAQDGKPNGVKADTPINANFYDNKDLLVVVGPETSPSFQRISFVNDDGSLAKVISVAPQKPAATTEFQTTIKRTKDAPTTLEASSIPPQNVVENKKRKKSEHTIASVDAKKLAEVEKGSRATIDAGDTNVTFQAALEQAIHTNDQQLLNKCFTIS